MNITLNEEQYSALVQLAREGARAASDDPRVAQDRIMRLEDFFRSIEKSNGVTRYLLWVQWQETDNPLPPTVRFPESWPPTQRQLIERLDRPIAKVDVDNLLAANAKKPVTVLVTVDPAGLVGWTEYDVYFNITP